MVRRFIGCSVHRFLTSRVRSAPGYRVVNRTAVGLCHTKSRMPLVPPYIESLRPYEAGRGIAEVQREYGLARVSKLGSNENPLGPAPLALQAMTRSMNGLNLYPNGGLDLRCVLAE